MKKGITSTQTLLGVKQFSRNGVQTAGHGELAYFLVTPTNISVLSRVSIAQKIRHLTQLLSAQPDIEIVCMDARENFDDNKVYLDVRREDETNPAIRELLEKDKRFLDDIQLEMSTAREFMFVVRLRNESEEQSFAGLNRIEQLINEQGFGCRRADRDDVKRVLSRYFRCVRADELFEGGDEQMMVQKWFVPD